MPRAHGNREKINSQKGMYGVPERVKKSKNWAKKRKERKWEMGVVVRG